MDRNTLTGFALMAVVLIADIGWNNYEQKQYEKKKVADSVAYVQAHPKAALDTTRNKAILAAQDSVVRINTDSTNAALPPALRHLPAQMVTLENKDVKLQVSTK